MLLPNKFSNWIYSLIPTRINNHMVITFYELLCKLQKLIKTDYDNHLISNRLAFPSHLPAIIQHNGYIEDQHHYVDMRYGKTTMQYAGCEIFAVYNAIYSLSGHSLIELPDLIYYFEKDGMTLNGKMGTSPMASVRFLENHHFHTAFTTNEKDFDTLAKACQSLIFTMYNNRNDIRKMVHTIHISKADNMYTAHNVYCNGTVIGPYPTFGELMENIHHGNAKGILLIGINP